jgi:hypothetical protein
MFEVVVQYMFLDMHAIYMNFSTKHAMYMNFPTIRVDMYDFLYRLLSIDIRLSISNNDNIKLNRRYSLVFFSVSKSKKN